MDMMIGTDTSEQFRRVCDGVWRDREAILTGRGGMSGEVALMRAVYWRLCKTWGAPERSTGDCHTGYMLLNYQRLVNIMLTQYAGSHFDGVSLLDELVRQYREETGPAAEVERKLKARVG